MSKPVMATTPPKAIPSPARTCQRCLVPAEELEDGDPGRLQADQRGGGSHRRQLEGRDEAGEVEGQSHGRNAATSGTPCR